MTHLVCPGAFPSLCAPEDLDGIALRTTLEYAGPGKGGNTMGIPDFDSVVRSTMGTGGSGKAASSILGTVSLSSVETGLTGVCGLCARTGERVNATERIDDTMQDDFGCRKIVASYARSAWRRAPCVPFDMYQHPRARQGIVIPDVEYDFVAR
jgi:hypothetical protein